MELSINQLSKLTGKDRRTITNRLVDITPIEGKKGAYLYASAAALEHIYRSGSTTLEEARTRQAISQERLNNSRDEELRKLRIPIGIPLRANDQVIQALTAELKAAKGKSLTEELINALLDKFRALPGKLRW